MFTGIIEETGVVSSLQKGGRSARITIRAAIILDDLKIGDSVSVNGVCLTAASLNGGGFTADVMNETLSRSNLGELIPGGRVNLERAMPADGRFGGHFVTGHIDGTGRILRTDRDDNAMWLTITAPREILNYIVLKGSVAIDGVSLTVAKADEKSFAVSVIPHTGKATILLQKAPGDTVNIETDIIGKYIARLHGLKEKAGKPESGVTMELLNKAGF